MWVLTPNAGFFSVIAYDQAKGKVKRKNLPADPDNVLVVRCRAEEDMQALQRYLPSLTYADDLNADYRYRALVSRTDWANFLIAQTAEIDYGNFKNAVADRQGAKRAGVYSRVWTVLCDLQPTAPWQGSRSRWTSWREWRNRDVVDIESPLLGAPERKVLAEPEPYCEYCGAAASEVSLETVDDDPSYFPVTRCREPDGMCDAMREHRATDAPSIRDMTDLEFAAFEEEM